MFSCGCPLNSEQASPTLDLDTCARPEVKQVLHLSILIPCVSLTRKFNTCYHQWTRVHVRQAYRCLWFPGNGVHVALWTITKRYKAMDFIVY